MDYGKVHMQPGESVTVRALHADGTCYRWWNATVERSDSASIVTVASAGRRIANIGGDWVSQNHIRAFYWLDQSYNLLEIYRPDGVLAEVYVHIASPAVLDGKMLTYTDYELDVVRLSGEMPQLVDEDDFAEAVIAYGYTAEFQRACYDTARDALEIVEHWQAGGW